MKQKNSNTVKKITLPNGLKIILKHLPNTKKACIMINVNVGSMDENKEEEGISHFIEHMTFKSNKHRTAAQLSRDLEYSGTITNAFTSHENTVYYGKCLKNKSKDTIQILFEAMTNEEYNDKELELERDVVLTEVQNHIELPDKQIFQLILKDLFENSNYSHPISGSKETVSNMKKETLQKYRQKYYVPNNMIICITGNFEEKSTIEKIKNTFGKLKKNNVPEKNIKLANSKYQLKIHKKKNLTQSFLAAAYIVPNNQKKESIYIELLSTLIGEGLSSKMFTKLREDNGIGYQVGSDYYNLGTTACFIMYIIGFDKKQEEKAKNILLEILEEMKTKKITDEEINGIKNQYLSHLIDDMQKPEHHALELLHKELYNPYYNYEEKEKHIKKISKENIKEIANKIFSKEITISFLN